jgi:hypothetical protein
MQLMINTCYSILVGKLLVTTGRPIDSSVKSEVIDLQDASNVCQYLNDYPIQVYYAVGGLINDVDPLVCGGKPVTRPWMI